MGLMVIESIFLPHSGKFQLARWSHRVTLFSDWDHPPTLLLGPSLIINLAQLVYPSVALPAELVSIFISIKLSKLHTNTFPD